MPTILRLGSLRVVIYTDDHRPAHVHVIGQGHEAVFILNCPFGPLRLRQNDGFPDYRLNQIATELLHHLAEMCNAWREMHDYA
jgi:hypothetical protein